MDLHSENVQTGLPGPDPDAGIEPATRENIDIDYEIMDVQGQLLDVAATLADRRGGAASSRDYLLCPVQLSSFTPEKRLSLFNSLVASPPFQIAETACSGFCFGLAARPQTDHIGLAATKSVAEERLPGLSLLKANISRLPQKDQEFQIA